MSVDAKLNASILIPSRERLESLAALLRSLRATGYLEDAAAEVLVVDNSDPGSTESAAVVALTSQYGVVRIPGAGPKSKALNAAVEQACGEHLVFIDDDTTITDKTWLRDLLGAFEPGIGYVAGNVRAAAVCTDAERIWEAKGGLSKGAAPVDMRPPGARHTNHAWRLKRVAAGANCAIRKSVFLEIGGFCERLGPGTPVGAGETVEIVDRALRAGYSARYVPTAQLSHQHPKHLGQLRRKLRGYARGDSALALHIAITQRDGGALAWALGGHQLYRLRNLVSAAMGRYALPARCAAASLLGSVEGIILYLATVTRQRGRTQVASRSATPANGTSRH